MNIYFSDSSGSSNSTGWPKVLPNHSWLMNHIITESLVSLIQKNLGWFPYDPHINSGWRKWRYDLRKYLTQFGTLRKHLLRRKCKCLLHFTSGVFCCKSNLQFVKDATIFRTNVWSTVSSNNSIQQLQNLGTFHDICITLSFGPWWQSDEDDIMWNMDTDCKVLQSRMLV